MPSGTVTGTVSPIATVFGNLTVAASTTPPTPGAGEDICTNCPDYIKAAVEAPVRLALQQIRTIKKRTAFMNAALVGKITSSLTGAVQAVVDAIPVPPVFDLAEIINTFTCPLTPVAIELDPSLLVQFDPRTLWKRLQDIFRAYNAQLGKDYEGGLASLQGADLVKIGKSYFEDLKRTEFDEKAFGRAVAISAYVLGICPVTHAAGPYAEFDAEITDFDLSGFIPIDTLEAAVRDFMLVLMEGELKLEAWRIAATQAPLF